MKPELTTLIGLHPVKSNKTGDPAVGIGFQQAHRLRASAEFSQVFAKRRVFRGRFFDLHYTVRSDLANSEVILGSARIGLVMAKKFSRRSVQRNTLKRIAREAFRHVRGQLPAYDLVLRLSRPLTFDLNRENRQVCREDILHLLSRVVQLSGSR